MRKKHPKVLLDCDGVFCDFVGGVLNALHSLTGRRFDPETIESWDIFSSLPDDVWHLKDTCFEMAGAHCRWLPVLPGASEAISEMREAGAELVVVTTPLGRLAPRWESDRRSWLFDHFAFTEREVRSTWEKHDIDGDIFVDDKPSHVKSWLEYWGGRDSSHPHLGYLWATPRERKPTNLPTLRSWGELLGIVRHLAETRGAA